MVLDDMVNLFQNLDFGNFDLIDLFIDLQNEKLKIYSEYLNFI